jgi:hypothetical protein
MLGYPMDRVSAKLAHQAAFFCGSVQNSFPEAM